MPETTISGTVRSLRVITTRKKDEEVVRGNIVVMSEFGERVDIKGDPALLNGFNPGNEVIVSIERAQKTIAESTEEKKKK